MKHLSIAPSGLCDRQQQWGDSINLTGRLLLAGEELIAMGPEQPSTSINKPPSGSVGLEVG